MTKLTPADLHTDEFVLQDKLIHKDLLPFIKQAYEQKNSAYYFYNGINLLFGATLLYLLFKDMVGGELKISSEFAYFSYGLLLSFTLIPFHEYVHALAYKYVGAKKTSYDMNLRKFYFMAMADKFVANPKAFRIVILAPFVVISALCLLAFFLLPGIWKYTAVGLFFTHTLFCSGDFGLLNYLQTHRRQELYTYDDKEKGESYFFVRKP